MLQYMAKKKAKKKSSIQKRRERYFGIVKVPKGTKVCWLAQESKNGFSLGLAFEGRTVWLKGLRFVNPKELAKVLKSNVVFVFTRDSKFSGTVKGGRK